MPTPDAEYVSASGVLLFVRIIGYASHDSLI